MQLLPTPKHQSLKSQHGRNPLVFNSAVPNWSDETSSTGPLTLDKTQAAYGSQGEL